MFVLRIKCKSIICNKNFCIFEQSKIYSRCEFIIYFNKIYFQVDMFPNTFDKFVAKKFNSKHYANEYIKLVNNCLSNYSLYLECEKY